MNIQKYLIIVKGEDKTEQIQSFESTQNYIYINYKNGEKIYTYQKKDFEFYKIPIEINTKQYKIIINQAYIYNIEKVIKFDKYYKIFFEDNTTKVVLEQYLQLLKKDNIKTLSINKFNYFKDISKIVSIKTEEGNALLTREYEKINFISKDTALYKYLTPKENLNITNNNLDKVIFPFGTNKSQFEAVRKALKCQISIIEGPPRYRKNSNYTKSYCQYCKKRANCSCCFK